MSCCQQYELYAAEGSVPTGRALRGKGEAQDYVDALRDTPWWERNVPQVLKVWVHARKSDAQGSCGGFHDASDHSTGVIEMAPVHMNELFILHELAHVLAEARYGSRAHDPWFARTYLELVYVAMGSETYVKLQSAFAAATIDHDHDSTAQGGIAL